MQLKKGQIVEIEIHALAFGGAGIGKYEGVTVFVDKTMPGDRVKAALTRIKTKFMDADLVEIVTQSPDRIKAKCRYSGICGGCQMQFMPYEKQLEFKKQQVIDAFERIGKIYAPPVEDVLPSQNQFYYRNKMEFSFGYDGEMNFTLGMHVPGRRFDIMDLEECHLESEVSYRIVNEIREFMRPTGWPPFKYSCGEGFLKGVFIREAKRTKEILINLRTSDALPEDFDTVMQKFVEMLTAVNTGELQIVSIYWTMDISKRGQPRKVVEKLIHGKHTLHEEMQIGEDKLSFDIRPQAFFQVNTFQAEVLYGEVLKMALSSPQKMVFDLFCGTGTIGLFLAKHVEQVMGIELNESAVTVARENAMKNAVFNIDFFLGDVAKVLQTVKECPSLIVVDPPRAGLTEKMISKINDFASSQIIYVSCNPATLARDCQIFAQYGYSVKKIQPVDMFPHTYHIENVCLLER